MTARVLPFRPREFYAVVPGSGGSPGESGPEPVFYERTWDGMLSAIEHAKFLSRGGARQDVTLTEGRRTRVIAGFENGVSVHGVIQPAPYETAITPPRGTTLRAGSPHGHIPEICTHGKMTERQRDGRKPRRNRNMPRPQWPGII